MCWQGCSPCTSPQWTVFCLLQCSLYTVFALFIAHCWAKHTPLQCQCVDRGCTPCTLWISASLEIERDFVVAWNFLLLKKIEVNWKYLLASLEIEPDFVVSLENVQFLYLTYLKYSIDLIRISASLEIEPDFIVGLTLSILLFWKQFSSIWS